MRKLWGRVLGLLAAVVIAAPAGNGTTLEQYEQLFGLDLTNPENATLDFDGDGLSNLSEAYKGTNPFRADTDDNGWPDASSHEITRARLDFNPLFIAGNSFSYFWPAWMVVSASKSGGEWDSNLAAWYVPAGNSGILSLIVDRALLTSDAVLELEFYGAPNAFLFIDLLNAGNETLISSERFGNLVDDSGMIVRQALNLPLADFSEAVKIQIRATGEFFLFEGLLYPAQEAALGTGDLMVATDGDTSTGRATASGRAAADFSDVQVGPLLAEAVRKRRPADERRPHKDFEIPRHQGPTLPESGTKPQEFRAVKIKSLTIPQFVMAQQAGAYSSMSGANFIMPRDTISGGGTRQTSPAFIMEDSLGQGSAIGFSYGGNITLHAGYQQAEAERLELWNVSAIPFEFNPTLGEMTALSYVLSSRSPNVTIEVYKPDTTNLLAQESQGPGLHSLIWDGANATPGGWTFRIRASDYQGRVITNETPVMIRQTIPVILAISDAPDPFCPTMDGTTTIAYTTVEPQNKNLDVTIAIEDAFGNPVTNVSWLNQAPGSYAYAWDGANARNGLFIYRINARRGGQAANEKTGSIILACGQECVTSQDGNVQVCYQPDGFAIAITNAAPGQVGAASRALLTAEPGLVFQGGIYEIKAAPPTSFDPPAILTFKYEEAIAGDIDAKLQIRRYDQAAANWVVVAPQFGDYANHRIIAEVTNFSLYALVAAEQPAVLPAVVRLEPEALNVNPGILTAFVRLPAGYDPVYITDTTCDGARYERMMLSNDGTEMILKFRRQDIEAALAEIGESIDIYFVVRGVWQDAAGNAYVFQGADSITKIF